MRISPLASGLVAVGLVVTLASCDAVDLASSPDGLDVGPANSTHLVEICRPLGGGAYAKVSVAQQAAAKLLDKGALLPGTGGLDADCQPAAPVDIVAETISAGGRHSCGLDTSGNAYCWGFNFSGQLGDGTNAGRNEPVAVAGGHTFASLSAGTAHTVALTPTGAAYAWGRNNGGQLGDGTNNDSNTPVTVVGGLTFASISAGGSSVGGGHTVALTPAAQAHAWGYNDLSQLGNGSFGLDASSNEPVPVSGEITFLL